MNQPKRARRAGGIILLAFLSLFALTNFLTLILTAAAAGEFWDEQNVPQTETSRYPIYTNDPSRPIIDRLPDGIPDPRDFQGQLQPGTVSGPNNIIRISVGPNNFANDPVRPYMLLADVAGITWVITSITFLFLFTKIRYFNHRVARYIFRVIGAATSVFLIIFYLTYAHADTFVFPFTIDWPLGKGGAIMAHINLMLGIFITLLAAALDTPKDWDAPTGPNSGRISQV
ncbi:hypothetical protein FDENT_2728 [Fusarium denticulatum]|uniref:Uncharacterized protein n=1 Tax=Fusarium denticulatum TaxID=48507 RepID=A0A8H5XFL8_9HYPO|nr:hypothetical protein FDENT_2728 [Fusarium denticulatum]